MAAPSPANPFHQPARQWQIRIFTQRDMAQHITGAFDDLALATLNFEMNEMQTEWRVDIITDMPPEDVDIPARLALVSGMHKVSTPHYEVAPLQPKDWVSEVEKSFPPLRIGRFFVHGSHIKSALPHNKIILEINAGMAFGSGEHDTTSGCLFALSALVKRRCFQNPLDMGCGSGILALAMAKLWRIPVTGIDIDPVSVSVARENAHRNRLHTLAQFAAGDGYHTPLAKRNALYDLIVANILARPLMRMAPLLAKNLSPDGIAVLSGLLEKQEHMVLAAHRAQGLKLISRIRRNGWSTLILSF